MQFYRLLILQTIKIPRWAVTQGLIHEFFFQIKCEVDLKAHLLLLKGKKKYKSKLFCLQFFQNEQLNLPNSALLATTKK